MHFFKKANRHTVLAHSRCQKIFVKYSHIFTEMGLFCSSPHSHFGAVENTSETMDLIETLAFILFYLIFKIFIKV